MACATSRTAAPRERSILEGAPLLGAAEAPDCDLAWAASGAMWLTGEADGPPVLAPAPLASAAAAALGHVAELAWRPERLAFDGAALLGERAACYGFTRAGQQAPGARCRLVRARDGWLAVNLARDDDLHALPAWLECGPAPFDWAWLAGRLAARESAPLLERARLLGLPVSAALPPPERAPAWCQIPARGPTRPPAGERPARVLDLSSLWAGPLCAHLLERAGADVVKLESRARPDGARRGDARFYALLNRGKRSVALDFGAPDAQGTLLRLVRWADVVVESARPRALRQLGIDADALVREQPGLTWVSITGHGREAPGGDWVAFGDDAAAAGGLCIATGDARRPLFCGDAIADPLTGLHAAVAALTAYRAGGGVVLDVALSRVVAHLAGRAAGARTARVRREPEGTVVECGDARQAVARPRARPFPGPAAALGAHTAEVLGAC